MRMSTMEERKEGNITELRYETNNILQYILYYALAWLPPGRGGPKP